MSDPWLQRLSAALARPAVRAAGLGLLAAGLALSLLVPMAGADPGEGIGSGGALGRAAQVLIQAAAAVVLAAGAWSAGRGRRRADPAPSSPASPDTPERVRLMLRQQDAHWREQLDKVEARHRKAAQRQSHWHELLDAFPGWVVTIRPDGTCGYVNATVARFYGLEGFQLAGRPADEVLGARVAAAIRRRNVHLSAHGQAHRFPLVLKAPDGAETQLLATQFIVGLAAADASMTCLIAVESGATTNPATGAGALDSAAQACARAAADRVQERLTALVQALQAAAARPPAEAVGEDAVPVGAASVTATPLARLARLGAELAGLDSPPEVSGLAPVDLVAVTRLALADVDALARARGVTLRTAQAPHGQVWVDAEAEGLRASLRAVIETAVSASARHSVVDVCWSVRDADAGIRCLAASDVFAPQHGARALPLLLAEGWLDSMHGAVVCGARDAGSECHVTLRTSAIPEDEALLGDSLLDAAMAADPASDEPKREILVLTRHADVLRSLRRLLRERPLIRVRSATSVDEALDLCARVAPDCVVWDAGDPEVVHARFVSRILTLAYSRPIRLVAMRPAPARDVPRGAAPGPSDTGDTTAGAERCWSWPLEAGQVLPDLDALLAAAPVEESIFDTHEPQAAGHMPA